MNKQLHDIKKAIDKIEVPHDKLNQAIHAGVKQAKTNGKTTRRKFYPMLVAVAATTFLTISSAFVSPTMAKVLSSVPVLDSVFEVAGDMGLVIASKRGLSEGIGQTVTDQGIGLTIQDVYYDGTRLSVGYVQEFTGERGRLGELQLKVNGKEINFGDGRTGKPLSDTQYAGVIDIAPVGELPDSFDLQIGLNEIGDVQGAWNFKIPVSKAKEDARTIESNQTVTYQDQTISINNVKIGAAGIKLSLTLTSPDEMSLQMIDDHLLQFNLLNDKGDALTMLDSRGTGLMENGKHVMNMEVRYEPLQEDSETLTVSPFLVPVDTGAPEKVENVLQPDQLPMSIDQGDMGSIIIKDIQYEKNQTLLTFETASDFPYDGHFQYNTLWLEDAKGNNLANNTQGYPERIQSNTYVQEFQKVKPNEPLTLVTFEMPYLKVLKDLEVAIPLD